MDREPFELVDPELSRIDKREIAHLRAEVERLHTKCESYYATLSSVVIDRGDGKGPQTLADLGSKIDDPEPHRPTFEEGDLRFANGRLTEEVERLRRVVEQTASLLDAAAEQTGSPDAMPIAFTSLTRGLAKTLRDALAQPAPAKG